MTNKGNAVFIGAGAALIAGFFLPWVDMGIVTASGWDAVTSGGTDFLTKIILAMVPLLGVGLLVAGLGGDRRAAATAGLVAGTSILGYTAYKVAWTFFKTTGIGLWLVLGAALIALVAGLALRGSKTTK
jgi:hypothetical protein